MLGSGGDNIRKRQEEIIEQASRQEEKLCR